MHKIIRCGATALSTLALCLGPGLASADTTTPSANGPQECIGVDANGTITAPSAGDCAQYGAAGNQTSTETAQNVILFIGDGMGDSEITSARNYLVGAAGAFAGLDNFTQGTEYTTFSLDKSSGEPNYVTDSAASGTGWATGTKTYNGAIGVDLEGNPVENLLEAAKNAGLKTGNVTTAEIQDATPAVQGSHALNRKCYGPDQSANSSSCQGDSFTDQFRENGGLGSISEQLVDTRADVTLGGGAEYFDQEVVADSGNTNPFLTGDAKYDTDWTAGESVLTNAENNGYQVVTTADELDAVSSADQSSPVLGLFSSGNMPRRYAATEATTDGATQDPVTCQANPEHTADVPDLADMTTKAIDLLDNDNGFFLQVESASIDKADHDADACGQIGETAQLDEAVQAAQEWAQSSGESTMIVVTADHGHASQIVGNSANTVGVTTALTTADGATMTISYADAESNEPDVALGGQEHTGTQVRIVASGPGLENIEGRFDQTDLHFTVLNALGINPDGVNDRSSAIFTSSTNQSVNPLAVVGVIAGLAIIAGVALLLGRRGRSH